MTVETMESKEDKKYGNETLLHKIGLVWFGMALLCVPIWWQTTSVERFPIPHSMIEDLHSKIQQIPDPNPKLVLETFMLSFLYGPHRMELTIFQYDDIIRKL